MKTNPDSHQEQKGFALVATILLMVLLSILAIGMLSLSTVSIRSGSRADSMAEARANARVALMIAIGELQKSMGPDRAISATSEILSTPSTPVAKPNITGVWESWWDFDPNSNPDYTTEKQNRFQRWLVSGPDSSAPESRDFVTSPWSGDTVELVGSGSLGASATAEDKVTAGLVSVSKNGEVRGSYAWHVSDESVKARVNLYRDPSQNSTLAQKRALLAGHRPDPSVIKDADGNLLTYFPTDHEQVGYAAATAESGKIIDLDQAELLDGASGKIKPLRNDITPYSLGVLSDVRGGGLKQDLSSIFEMGGATANTLPADFTGERLYESTHGITGVSDPNWSALAGYYNSFRSLSTPDTNPTVELKQDAASLDPVPETFSPAPVIAKADVIFSIVARPLSDQMAWWIRNPAGAGGTYDHMVSLIVTPVVTLHNPYNVNVTFNKMQVEFSNIPVGFNFMFQNGAGGGAVSQSIVPGSFECFNTMAYRGHKDPETGVLARNNKRFVLTIANWSTDTPLKNDSTISGPIILKPGQTVVCGPTLPPSSSFDQDTKSGSNAVGFDWEGDLLDKIKAKPAFIPGLGFEVSAVTISSFRSSNYPTGSNIPGKSNFFPGAWRGHPFTLLRDVNTNPLTKTSDSSVIDRFYLEYKIVRPYWYTDDITVSPTQADPSFAVSAKIQATDATNDEYQEFARLQFDYEDESTLQNLFDDRVYRYPPTGSMAATEFGATPNVPYSMQSSFVRPFAIFSAYARTTNGGVYETGNRTESPIDSPEVNLLQDGRLAGKPFLYHNPSRTNFTINLADQKPGVQAYELNFQPFLSNGDFEDYMDVDVNRVPALTGNKTGSGIKSGSYLEIPSGPLQTIADFRRSNALTTTYLPHFVQPVGNSRLHPLMSPDKVVETNTDIASHDLLDHSVLANHALYDRFYFSTFATRGSTTPDTVFEQFMDGETPLALQSFTPYLPGSKSVAEAKAELFASGKPTDTAYQTAAEYQMIRGPFNVNSTSAQAWKAVLASMNKSDIITLWARTAALETQESQGVPIPPMTLVNGGVNRTAAVDSSKIDTAKTNDWNGYRELTEAELETLAEKIVEQVRERGPFLSMSEFVNRQIGPVGPKTLSGALEAAIAEAEINEEQDAVFPETFLDQIPITETDVSDPNLYNYETPEATTGNPAAGAPGWVNQADLLRILEPSATVRGDTFVIRVYGEAKDSTGTVTARAYAEAVMQRVPDYVDEVDRPSVNVYADPSASVANKTFGRRIEMASFRWLSKDEI